MMWTFDNVKLRLFNLTEFEISKGTILTCKEIRIRKSKFVANTQFLYRELVGMKAHAYKVKRYTSKPVSILLSKFFYFLLQID